MQELCYILQLMKIVFLCPLPLECQLFDS
uniref:Uncharacterized protein n=1 Tax=Rhizophora mucronata TaxID=61149 RepID=A0A2P2R1G7_RHIMU